MDSTEFTLKFNLFKAGASIPDKSTKAIAVQLETSIENVKEILKKQKDNVKKMAADINCMVDINTANKNFLFIGDSITCDREGYVSIIEEKFSDSSAKIINVGISGIRSSDLVQKIHSLIEIRLSDVDIVVIMIGTNDLASSKFIEEITTTSINEYKRNIEFILSRLNDKRVIINSIPPACKEMYDRAFMNENWSYSEVNRKKFNTALKKITVEKGIVYNDLDTLFADYDIKNLVIDDGLHLNSLAQSLVAKSIIDLITL